MRHRVTKCRMIFMVRVNGAYVTGGTDLDVKGVESFKDAIRHDWRDIKPMLTELVGDEVQDVVSIDIAHDDSVERLVSE